MKHTASDLGERGMRGWHARVACEGGMRGWHANASARVACEREREGGCYQVGNQNAGLTIPIYFQGTR